MIWAFLIAFGLFAFTAGGGRTFGPREGLAKISIPDDTRLVIWVDDARSVVLYGKDGKLYAAVRNAKKETIGPLPGEGLLDTVAAKLKLAEFENSAVRLETLKEPILTWHVMPAADGWHWVSSAGSTVTSGVEDSRPAAIGAAWASMGEVA